VSDQRPPATARIEQVHTESDLTVRPENGEPEERQIVHAIIETAFGRPEEADLVARLRAEGAVLISLVAVLDNAAVLDNVALLEDAGKLDKRIVGHILFSRMFVETRAETAAGSVAAVALAPVAVLPEHQRQGIGGRLIRHGLDLLRRQGEQIVIVLGHPDYYKQFGFSTHRAALLESPFPRDTVMATELRRGALDGIHGRVKYPAAFGL
jgi:putative acetyltransferase